MHVKGDEGRNARTDEPRIEAGINRRRLTSVVELARIYADLGVKEIADAVGRDKTRIIPPTGNPKLDMIDSLAGVLEWTVGDVVNALEGGSKNGRRAIHTRRLASGRRFGKLHLISKKLDRKGRWKWSRVVSGMLLLNAVNSRERSVALGMLGLSQMRGGDLRDALVTLRKGLNEDGIRFETELEIKTLLCRTHLLLEHHLEAKSVANEILGSIERHASRHRADFRNAERTARYVRGNSVRASIDQGIGVADLREARSDLLISLQIPETNPEHDLDENTVSLGAILEIDTALGKISHADAIRRIDDALESASLQNENGTLLKRNRRSWAWWGLFGARIVLRESTKRTSWQKAHVLAQKAIEFSSDQGDALLRAKGYALSFEAWKRGRSSESGGISWHLEPDELEIFVKTMGAKIGFMEPGWRILDETGALERAKTMDPRTWRKGFRRA